MPNRSVLLALSLVACTLLGCKSEDRPPGEVLGDAMQATRAAIRDVVDDRSRQLELLALVDRLDRLLQDQSADLSELSRRIRRINADPDAARSAFDAEIAVYQERRRARRSNAVDIHFAMMELARPDEWSRIVSRELDALEALGRTE